MRGLVKWILLWLVVLPKTTMAEIAQGVPRPPGFLSVPMVGPFTGNAALLRDQVRGAYSDTFTPLKPQVRDWERDPQNRYTYCLRTAAVYECLSYAGDGSVRRQRTRVVSHGTGFAYREQGGETYLLTNQHVTDWPPVTDAQHRVDDVPAGCKRISDSLKIVDNEEDDYAADDLPLTRVVTDETLDATVVKAHARLRRLPYRFGRSDALKSGDVVLIQGFPLGAFQAVNTGKVVNPYDHDEFKDWDHVDFIVDAPLSSGNSGSPVLAVSKRTGEYELLGMFHASYSRGTALNAVIGIDSLRDLMMNLKRSGGAQAAEHKPGPAQRAEFAEQLQQQTFVPYLQLGPLLVAVRRVGDSLLYEIFSRRFPVDDRRLLVVADRPAPGTFGTLGPLWLGNERGLKGYEAEALEPEVQGQMQAVLRRLHGLAVGTLRYRQNSERAAASRDAMAERSALQRALAREAAGDPDLAQTVADLAERLSPRPAEQALTVGAVLTVLGAPGAEPAPAGSLVKAPVLPQPRAQVK